jgi:hypothetical protein
MMMKITTREQIRFLIWFFLFNRDSGFQAILDPADYSVGSPRESIAGEGKGDDPVVS